MNKLFCDMCNEEIGKGEKHSIVFKVWEPAKGLAFDGDKDFCKVCWWQTIGIIEKAAGPLRKAIRIVTRVGEP